MKKEEAERNRRFWALPVEERQRELVRRVNKAFGLRLENHHEAIGAMKAAVAGAMVCAGPDRDEELMPDGMGCPKCGCRAMDKQVFREDAETVDCQQCGHAYDAGTGSEVRERPADPIPRDRDGDGFAPADDEVNR